MWTVVIEISGFVEPLEVEIDDSDSKYGMADNWQAYGTPALARNIEEQVQICFDDSSAQLARGSLLIVQRK